MTGRPMRLLVISPDYLSHALPLTQIGAAWAQRYGDVVVATGVATRSVVEAAGLDWVELRLGAGHNGGVIEVEQQRGQEAAHLRAFFDATRAGPIETLLYQADARRHDLMHEPDRVLDRLVAIVDTVRPDRVVVDHVAFGARSALAALGIEAATVVLGHPTALVAPGEVYGSPPEWPVCLRQASSDLDELSRRCKVSVDHLHEVSAEFLARRSPAVGSIPDLTSTPGRPTIYVYPEELHHPSRARPTGTSVGALARAETLGAFTVPTGSGPLVMVALGSFLSARDDVLATAVAAARIGKWRLVLASGSSSPESLGEPPDGAVIVRHLPQVALLQHADVFVHHGGNGSVTEAAAAGVPTVVLPFSTDQFAGAAAIERVGVGAALAPNTLTVDELVGTVDELLTAGASDRSRDLAASVARADGAASAVDVIRELGVPPVRLPRHLGTAGTW